MIKRTLLLVVFLYFLALLQTAFGFLPNLIFIVAMVLVFFSRNVYLSLMGAMAGGFFLDVFSNKILGWHILILVAAVLFIKIILKKYVRAPVG